MRLQIIQDGEGQNAGVFIPYKDWTELKKQFKGLEFLEHDETGNEILNNIKKGLEEVQLFKNAKLNTVSAQDFLNEV